MRQSRKHEVAVVDIRECVHRCSLVREFVVAAGRGDTEAYFTV
jgi:hypothetical protein